MPPMTAQAFPNVTETSLRGVHVAASLSARTALNAIEAKVCRVAGVDPAAFIAAKTSLAGDATKHDAMPSTLTGLNADESAVCRTAGVDPAAFIAAKSQRAPAAPLREACARTFKGLNAEEATVCRATGVDPAAFLAAKHSGTA